MSWFLVVELPTLLAEFFIACTFYKDFLSYKKRNQLLWPVCIIAFVAIANLSNLFIDNFALKMFLSLTLYFALSFMFGGNKKLKILAACLYYIFLVIADAVVFYCIVLIFKINPNAILSDETLLLIGYIASKLLILLIAKIVGSLRKKDNVRLSIQHWIAIVTYPIVSCFFLFVFLDVLWQLNSTNQKTSLASAIAALCVLYFNIIAFRLFEYFAERSERELRERLLKSQVAAQVKEMERQNYEKIAKREFLHDLRHHNQLLYTLVEKGQAKEALELISKMLKLNEHEGDYVHTGNSAINALFNSQLGYANSQGIKIDVDEIYLPTGVILDIEDICIIFANSLENAIEACQRVEMDERHIKVVLKHRDNRLVYKISNPTDGNLINDRTGRFKSTKTTPGEHGLGIGNIEKAVNKYGGVFKVEHSDNVFTLGFSIPVYETANIP